MRLEHIFGDLESEAAVAAVPRTLFAHPKAEGVFGQKRLQRSEPGRARSDAELCQEAMLSRH